MKKVFFALLLFAILLVSCKSNYYQIHESATIITTEDVTIFKGKKYCVLDFKLYTLENNSLTEVASVVREYKYWDAIGNVYSTDECLIIINHYNLYYVDENLNVLFKYPDIKSSSLKWIQIGNKLYFLDDDVNCRNIAYFDIDKREKITVLKNAKKDSTYLVDTNLFYIDFDYDLHLVEENVNYKTQKTSAKVSLLDSKIDLKIDGYDLFINEKKYEIIDNLFFFPRIECHNQDVYFALYRYNCDCYSGYDCLCNYNDIVLYRYNLLDSNLEVISKLPSQSFIINMSPLVYYFNGKIIKEEDEILSFDIKLGNEYSYNEANPYSARRNFYGIVYYEDIYAARLGR